MLRFLNRVVLLILLAACRERNALPAILPRPVSIQTSDHSFMMSDTFKIIAPADEDGKKISRFLYQALTSKNLPASEKGKKIITLRVVTYDSLVPEGFHHLSINESGVTIQSNTGAGLFYGVQSLLQLLPGKEQKKEIQAVEITDYPRFPYRGLHLDVGRHFFPATFIKQYIDWLAFHKFNYFHWHLTEDQGWRMEIKKYPKLQEIAAYRKETLIGHAGKTERFDGKRYGGYYTQDEIKDVIQYAADRYVTIIPEIEMPGHALAALAAYPSLGCTGGPYEVSTRWGVFPDVFCAGKEETFEFLQNVLDEVVALFPSRYVHIGGDECPKTQWKVCPACQKRIKEEGLKDEHELQSYFIKRIEKYLNGKDRQIIGWDEILEGGLAPNASVMSWTGEEGGIAAAKQKHPVIMTPGNWCYFDHYQDTTAAEPLAIGGFTSVKEVYGYEPLPASLSPDEAKFILGAQGNVWTEYMESTDHVEYMVYPRACALAEVVWSPKSARDYSDFLVRMKIHLKQLDDRNIHYAKHILKEFLTINK